MVDGAVMRRNVLLVGYPGQESGDTNRGHQKTVDAYVDSCVRTRDVQDRRR